MAKLAAEFWVRWLSHGLCVLQHRALVADFRSMPLIVVDLRVVQYCLMVILAGYASDIVSFCNVFVYL